MFYWLITKRTSVGALCHRQQTVCWASAQTKLRSIYRHELIVIFVPWWNVKRCLQFRRNSNLQSTKKSTKKSTFPNSNSIRNSRATGLSVERLLCATLVKQSQFIYLFIYLFNQAYYFFYSFGRDTIWRIPRKRVAKRRENLKSWNAVLSKYIQLVFLQC